MCSSPARRWSARAIARRRFARCATNWQAWKSTRASRCWSDHARQLFAPTSALFHRLAGRAPREQIFLGPVHRATPVERLVLIEALAEPPRDLRARELHAHIER